MGYTKQARVKEPPVTFETTPSAQGATGFFGLEDEAEEVARQIEIEGGRLTLQRAY